MLQFIRRNSLAFAAVSLALLGPVPAGAHHGFTGGYDATRPIYIEGTVQQVTIAHPHVEMTVQVAGRATVPAQLPKIADLTSPMLRNE